MRLIPTQEESEKQWRAHLKRELGGSDERELAKLRAYFIDDVAVVARIDARLIALGAERRRAAMLTAGVLLPARDITAIATDAVKRTGALDAARQWCDPFRVGPITDDVRPWLFLIGSAGVGKSFAAAWMIAEAGRGRVIRASQLVAVMCPSYDDESYGKIDTGDPGVLEDLGAEHDEKRFASALGEYFETRLNTPTIITSNLSAADLRNRYDARLLDRVRDRAVVVELAGESMRRQDGGL